MKFIIKRICIWWLRRARFWLRLLVLQFPPITFPRWQAEFKIRQKLVNKSITEYLFDWFVYSRGGPRWKLWGRDFDSAAYAALSSRATRILLGGGEWRLLDDVVDPELEGLLSALTLCCACVGELGGDWKLKAWSGCFVTNCAALLDCFLDGGVEMRSWEHSWLLVCSCFLEEEACCWSSNFIFC